MRHAIVPLICLLLIASTASARPKRFSATAYCLNGRTSSGQRPRVGTVAADPRVLPIGTVIRIPPNRGTYRVMDTGGGIRGHELDIYMKSCRAARMFGRRRVPIEIVRRPPRR